MRLRNILFAIFLVIFVWSAIRPHDYFTWVLEVFPAVLGGVLLIATRDRFPLTPLLYVLLFVHAVILVVGGHYTYALVPLGDWMRDAFGFTRNHYDRIGHLALGIFPIFLAREVLLRTSPLQSGKWLLALSISLVFSFAAFWELLEWWVTLLVASDVGQAFLGSQGDIWDAQWDMLLALLGAIASLLLASRLHDRSMARVPRGVG